MTAKRLLTEAEVVLMANHAQGDREMGERNALMVLTLYYSACRRSEVMALRPCDLFSGGLIEISWKKSRGRLSPTRRIAIPLWLHGRLQAYAAHAKLTLHARFWPFSDVYCWMMVSKFGRQALGRDDVHPHLLRHSRAVHLLRQTHDISTVQSHLGHAGIHTTLEYLRLVSDEDAAERIRQLMEKVPPTLK